MRRPAGAMFFVLALSHELANIKLPERNSDDELANAIDTGERVKSKW